MDMDIIQVPSHPVAHRKRSWAEEQYEPPKKRTQHTWIREKPPATELDYPIIQQVQNIALGTHAEGNGVSMMTDEPARHKPMFFPPSPVSRPTSPPPATHNTPAPYNPAGISTRSIDTTITPALPRPSDPTQNSSNNKKRFAIGPRANCEKCSAREPGHYGHWL